MWGEAWERSGHIEPRDRLPNERCTPMPFPAAGNPDAAGRRAGPPGRPPRHPPEGDDVAREAQQAVVISKRPLPVQVVERRVVAVGVVVTALAAGGTGQQGWVGGVCAQSTEHAWSPMPRTGQLASLSTQPGPAARRQPGPTPPTCVRTRPPCRSWAPRGPPAARSSCCASAPGQGEGDAVGSPQVGLSQPQAPAQPGAGRSATPHTAAEQHTWRWRSELTAGLGVGPSAPQFHDRLCDSPSLHGRRGSRYGGGQLTWVAHRQQAWAARWHNQPRHHQIRSAPGW